jgi:hypothetical protein
MKFGFGEGLLGSWAMGVDLFMLYKLSKQKIKRDLDTLQLDPSHFVT